MGLAMRRVARAAMSTARLLASRNALFIISLFAFAALAVPLHRRQTWTGRNSRELWEDGCKPIIFIFCRETIAPGNMGITVGPALSNSLKSYFGRDNVATQGVDYLALPITNLFKGGGPEVGIKLMQQLLRQATLLCPDSFVVAAGYSQGAAVTHRAIEFLPAGVRDRIAGVVTFGDTQTKQDYGQIWGYPLNRTLIICNKGDVICSGTLFLVPSHYNYMDRVPEAAAFLISRILIAIAERRNDNGLEPTTVSTPITTFTTTLPPPPTLTSVPSSLLGKPTPSHRPPRVTTTRPRRPPAVPTVTTTQFLRPTSPRTAVPGVRPSPTTTGE